MSEEGEESYQAKSLLLFEVNSQENDRLRFYEENLEELLRLVGDRELSIISIVGNSQQGTSLLIAYILQFYEQSKNKNTQTNKRTELNMPSFSSHIRDSNETNLLEVRIYRQPLKIEKHSAVLLIYTENNDVFSEEKYLKAIASLFIHVSSLTIVSTTETLPVELLINVDTLVQNTLPSTSTDFFQTLNFSVFGVALDSTFKYGEKGGRKNLQEVLSRCTEDIQERIDDSFELVNCFLFPESGKPKNFDGNWTTLNPDFVECLKKFVYGVVGSHKPRFINGKYMTGEDLLYHAHAYAAKHNDIVFRKKMVATKGAAEKTSEMLKWLTSTKKPEIPKKTETTKKRVIQPWSPNPPVETLKKDKVTPIDDPSIYSEDDNERKSTFPKPLPRQSKPTRDKPLFNTEEMFEYGNQFHPEATPRQSIPARIYSRELTNEDSEEELKQETRKTNKHSRFSESESSEKLNHKDRIFLGATYRQSKPEASTYHIPRQSMSPMEKQNQFTNKGKFHVKETEMNIASTSNPMGSSNFFLYRDHKSESNDSEDTDASQSDVESTCQLTFHSGTKNKKPQNTSTDSGGAHHGKKNVNKEGFSKNRNDTSLDSGPEDFQSTNLKSTLNGSIKPHGRTATKRSEYTATKPVSRNVFRSAHNSPNDSDSDDADMPSTSMKKFSTNEAQKNRKKAGGTHLSYNIDVANIHSPSTSHFAKTIPNKKTQPANEFDSDESTSTNTSKNSKSLKKQRPCNTMTEACVKNKPTNSKLLKGGLKKYQSLMKIETEREDRDYLSEKSLLKANKIASKKALQSVTQLLNKNNDNSEEEEPISSTLEKTLKKKFQQEFDSIGEGNMDAKESFFQENIKISTQTLNKVFNQPGSDDTDLQKKSTKTIETLVSNLRTKMEDNSDTDEEPITKLQDRLKKIEKRLLEDKRRMATELQVKIDTAINKWATKYNQIMEEILNDESKTDIKPFATWHAETVGQSHNQLKQELGSDCNFDTTKRLATILEESFYKWNNKWQQHEKDNSIETAALVQRLEEGYKNELMENEYKLQAASKTEQMTFYNDTVSKILEEFSRICPYGDRNKKKFETLQELKRQLEQYYLMLINNLMKQKNKLDKQTGDAFHQCCTSYENEMSKLVQSEPVNDAVLQNKNDELLHISCEKYRKMLEKINISDTDGKLNELKDTILQIFYKIKSENHKNYCLAESKAGNLIPTCLKDYQQVMDEGRSEIKTSEDLLRLHKSALGKAKLRLKSNSPIKYDPAFIAPHIEKLEKEAETEFQDIQELHEMRMSKAVGDIAAALRKARTTYAEEMEKHFTNNAFIKPETLEECHKNIRTRTLSLVQSAIPNLEDAQLRELKAKIDYAFRKYKEQNHMNSESEPAIGIDLGTTYSCVALYSKGKVHIIPNHYGKKITPSYVAFQKDGTEIVGDQAKSKAYTNPENTIFDAKRIIGRKCEDPKLQEDMQLWPFTVVDDFGVPKISVHGNKIDPEEVSAKLLKQLKKDAEMYFKREVKKAVITVPAYFTDGQRQATIDAGEMAGLEVLSILAEPTAAALAYKLQHSEEMKRNVLVFDLGGGTFDVAIMSTSKGKIDILAIDGDTHLGGEDFDKNLMTYCAEEFQMQHGINLFQGKDSNNKSTRDDVRRLLKRLQGECERRKIDLTTAPVAEVSVDSIHGDINLCVSISRSKFEDINDALFKKTLQVVNSALLEAKLDKSKIDDIVLVGGSTRIPKVQKMLETFFGGKMLDCTINPDEAVAYGAAMKAAALNGGFKENDIGFAKIQDITPMSIGVEVYGGGLSVIIPRSTKIPAVLTERYKTAHNNQTSVQITIFQGENPIAVKNQHLGDFYLNGIPPRKAGVENIDVEMVINSQGILNVSAVSSSTGSKKVSVIEHKQRMGKAAVERYKQLDG